MTGTTGAPRDPKNPRGTNDSGGSAASVAGHGFVFVIALLAGLKLGEWGDRRLGTAPWLMIVGTFTGAGLAFYSMYSKLMAAQRRDDEARAARRAAERAAGGPEGPR